MSYRLTRDQMAYAFRQAMTCDPILDATLPQEFRRCRCGATLGLFKSRYNGIGTWMGQHEPGCVWAARVEDLLDYMDRPAAQKVTDEEMSCAVTRRLVKPRAG